MAVFDKRGNCESCGLPKDRHERDVMWEEWSCPKVKKRAPKKPKTKTLKITGCTECPHVEKSYTFKGNHSFACLHPAMKKHFVKDGLVRWDGTTGRVISQECERMSEWPSGFPEWCPL